VNYVLDKLAATQKVGGGTMLDSTVVLWGNELGLLVSICQAMGLSDVTTFGIPELCTGPLTGLTG